ncbi:Beta-1, 4-N-acetylgalactosaminyltransferase bre-4 [Sarcoptes scabiei]|nr:Beta-1, 4-N-acetylgalactosaminyltransferase bre-4 [Sarcoptes scabiei]UXI21504.1 Ela2 protein [Sarcoptes scabiei]
MRNLTVQFILIFGFVANSILCSSKFFYAKEYEDEEEEINTEEDYTTTGIVPFEQRERIELIKYHGIEIPTTTLRNIYRCWIEQYFETNARFRPRNLTYRIVSNEKDIVKGERYLQLRINHGGYYRPRCNPIQKVAIIVPYRNRPSQLRMFVYNLHQFLLAQYLIEYRIFVIEQRDRELFNRAKLLNIGFREANRFRSDERYDCFIFHDIELVPMNLGNFYVCGQSPIHMSHNIIGFIGFYDELFGGVCALQPSHFISVNGFSNRFYGWGGEDDEMRLRLIRQGYEIERLPSNLSIYRKFAHQVDELNPPNSNRFELLKHSAEFQRYDGLSNLKYRVVSYEATLFYTLIAVEI